METKVIVIKKRLNYYVVKKFSYENHICDSFEQNNWIMFSREKKPSMFIQRTNKGQFFLFNPEATLYWKLTFYTIWLHATWIDFNSQFTIENLENPWMLIKIEFQTSINSLALCSWAYYCWVILCCIFWLTTNSFSKKGNPKMIIYNAM